MLTWAAMTDVWMYTLKCKLQQTIELFSQKVNRRLSGSGKQSLPEIFSSDKKNTSATFHFLRIVKFVPDHAMTACRVSRGITPLVRNQTPGAGEW